MEPFVGIDVSLASAAMLRARAALRAELAGLDRRLRDLARQGAACRPALRAHQAAMVMMHRARPCWLKAWGPQLARRRGMKRAVLAMARRIGFRALTRPHRGHGRPSLLHRMWVDGAELRFARAEAITSPA